MKKRFTTKYYFLPAIALLTLVTVATVRCTKPTDGINVNVNTSDLFHYTALVQIKDPSGTVPNNLKVTINGPNAAAIYGIDGKKSISAPAGVIALAVHPKMEPTEASPLKFNVIVSGPGYLTLTIPVSIDATQKSQIFNASILNLTVATPGVGSSTVTATAAAGTVVAPIAVTTPTAGGTPATAVTVPTGTRLQDANGATISGNAVSLTVNSFNAGLPDAIELFPGSSVCTENYVDNTGTVTSAALIPAGFANIQMTVNGTEVKKFSAPINVNMSLNPAFVDPNTGIVIAAGQTLEIDSYDTGTGQWKFEQNATVTLVGGKPVVNFTTNHLTEYAVVARSRAPIFKSLKVKLSTTAPIGPEQTYILNYSVYYETGPVLNLVQGQIIVTDKILENPLPFPILPGSLITNKVLIVFNNSGISRVSLPVNASSFVTVDVHLSPPGPVTKLTMKLDCSGAGSNKVGIITPPDFYLQFKPTGTPVTDYQVLGLVKGGVLTTNQLVSTTNYDFRAALNNSTKEVINHNISENVPANQVIGGSFNGTKAAVTNQLSIRELCNTLP